MRVARGNGARVSASVVPLRRTGEKWGSHLVASPPPSPAPVPPSLTSLSLFLSLLSSALPGNNEDCTLSLSHCMHAIATACVL